MGVSISLSQHTLEELRFEIWTRRIAPRVGDAMFSYETRLAPGCILG